MNGLIKKKLNLLVHLARVDGEFHKSERAMISEIAERTNVPLDDHIPISDPIAQAGEFDDKEEILYLALKLIQSDNVITEEELKSCRRLAGKLGFQQNVIDHFAHAPLPSMTMFSQAIKGWK